MNIKKSLTLLNVKALNADFRVATLVVQKLIKKKDVRPMSSQPKNNIMVLPEVSRILYYNTRYLLRN